MSDELIFTALGPSGAGKTTLLSCMHKKFEEILPGSFYPADSKTFGTLTKAYKKLESEADRTNLEFAVDLAGTSDLREYSFNLRGKGANIPVRFYDFPGGWIDPYDESQLEHHKKVIDIVQRSQVIFAAINTPYIMEFNGRYKDYTGITEIEHVIKMSLLDNDSNKLIILVPIKCERYTRTLEDTRKMNSKIKEVFAESIRLSKNPAYKERLAIALMPVHTVGNAQFSRFNIQGSEIKQEVYIKNRALKFSPRDTDQPLRFAMNFLLNEFARNNKFASIFHQQDLNAMREFISDGMKLDSQEFEILCGKDLITKPVNIIQDINIPSALRKSSGILPKILLYMLPFLLLIFTRGGPGFIMTCIFTGIILFIYQLKKLENAAFNNVFGTVYLFACVILLFGLYWWEGVIFSILAPILLILGLLTQYFKNKKAGN